MNNSVALTLVENNYVIQITRVLSDPRLTCLYSPEQYGPTGAFEKYHVLTKELVNDSLIFKGHVENQELQHEKYFLSRIGSQMYLNFEGDPSNYAKVHDFFIEDLKRMLKSAKETLIRIELNIKTGGGPRKFPGMYLRRGTMGRGGRANFESRIKDGFIQRSFYEMCEANGLTLYKSNGKKPKTKS